MARQKQNTFPMVIENRVGKVTIYQCKNRENWVTYTVSWITGEGRRRENHSDLKDAIGRAEEILEDYKQGRLDRTDTPTGKLMYYKSCEAKLGGVPLLDAVDFYLAHHASSTGSPQLETVITAYLKTSKDRGVSARQYQTLTYHLNKLKSSIVKPITSVQVSDLRAHLASVSDDLRTQFNHRRSIVALFNWAKAQKYLPHNEPSAAQNTEVPNFKTKEPEIYTPKEMAALLVNAEKDIIPFLALGAFAGLRTAELGRLAWEHIRLDSDVIAVPRDVTKKWESRTVAIKPNLKEWLLKYKKDSGPILPGARPHRMTSRAAEKAGVAWKDNALRHSCISYAISLDKNTAATALESGNSERMISKHYKALVLSKTDAILWYSITPQTAVDIASK